MFCILLQAVPSVELHFIDCFIASVYVNLTKVDISFFYHTPF